MCIENHTTFALSMRQKNRKIFLNKEHKVMKRRRILYVGTFAELARFVELQVFDGYEVEDDENDWE